jgi:CelD/BcsL family acetyltransferase involved in cellulose biosynthesis
MTDSPQHIPEIAPQNVLRETESVHGPSNSARSYDATIAELSLSDIDELEEEWRQLVARGDYSEPFFQPYWFRAFAQSFHGGKPAPFVLVRSGGILKGILPLMRSSRFWDKIPARSLRSLSGVHTCRYDFICESLNTDHIAESAWRALEEDGSWNVIEARNVPAGGGFEAIMRHADRDGYLVARWPTLLSPYLKVPVGQRDALKNCPDRYRKDRKRVANQLRKLEAEGDVSFEVLTTFDEAFFQEFLQLEGAGWKGRAGGAIACNPTVIKFYQESLCRAGTNGHLRMCALKLNGKRIAMKLNLLSENRCYSPKIAYDEAFSKFGPGQVINMFVIQDLADRGVETYDFLGPRARNKAVWAGEVRPHANCFIFRPTVAGTLYYLLAARVGPLLKRLKYTWYGDPQNIGDSSENAES